LCRRPQAAGAAGASRCSLFGPDAVVVFVVITGGSAGLSAGTKPWRRTSWSSSTSGHRRRLGGEAQWWPDEAVRCAAHLVMRALQPPTAAGQSRRPSSSPRLASIEDTDDDEDNVDDAAAASGNVHGGTPPLSSSSSSLLTKMAMTATKVLSRQSSGAGRQRVLCRLLRRLQPDLSSAAFIIVRSSTLSPPAAVPYHQPSPAAVLSITFAAPIDGWLLHSLPTQQHTN